mmetsp:Transcript_2881/g.6632  ORF Transcript_2881/g.6632 Transcript_2881/m.6632 type:complete len:242 (-) Transcript_2881:386-1111(-)
MNAKLVAPVSSVECIRNDNLASQMLPPITLINNHSPGFTGCLDLIDADRSLLEFANSRYVLNLHLFIDVERIAIFICLRHLLHMNMKLRHLLLVAPLVGPPTGVILCADILELPELDADIRWMNVDGLVGRFCSLPLPLLCSARPQSLLYHIAIGSVIHVIFLVVFVVLIMLIVGLVLFRMVQDRWRRLDAQYRGVKHTSKDAVRIELVLAVHSAYVLPPVGVGQAKVRGRRRTGLMRLGC